MKVTDFKVIWGGSFYQIQPKTGEAAALLRERSPEDALFWGDALMVTPEYIGLWIIAIQQACLEEVA